MHHQMKFTRPAALAKMARTIDLLTVTPMTAAELADALPISKRHAQEYINQLMADGRVFIIRWARHVEHSQRMYPRPVYAVGQGIDAPQPEPLTPEQRKKRAWARVKADPERYVTHLLKKRKYRADVRGPRADVAAAWITPANDEMQEAA